MFVTGVVVFLVLAGVLWATHRQRARWRKQARHPGLGRITDLTSSGGGRRPPRPMD